MTEIYKPSTPLTFSLLKSIIDKVEYWINAEGAEKGLTSKVGYYECDSFIYDNMNHPEFPLLIINKPLSDVEENVKIWFDEELNEIETNIKQSAEDCLSLYIEIENIINIETTRLEKLLFTIFKENEPNIQETI